MVAMEAADAKGGDKRCNCETDPKPSAPATADRARRLHRHGQEGRRDDQVAQSGRLLPIRVTDEDIKPSENANLVNAAHAYDA